jgi:hypothetical protein
MNKILSIVGRLGLFDNVQIEKEPERGVWLVVGINLSRSMTSDHFTVDLLNLQSRVSTRQDYSNIIKVGSGLEEALVCGYQDVREDAAAWVGSTAK